ncbi:MAG: acyltransferase [Patescibacteria group bacterium]
MPPTNKPYFVGLDNLRAYAFALVFLSHMYFNFFPANEVYRKTFAHGEIGVQIFFVLSAFLIMYLSLREFSKTGTFSVLHFFKKRILRIWPVYFLVVAVSYLIYILSGTTAQMSCTYMFLYFMGNTCMIQDFAHVGGALTISPLWSVSVEQQFYTIFPLLFLLAIVVSKKYAAKYKLLFCIIACIIPLVAIIYALYIRYLHVGNWRYTDYSLASSIPSLVSGICLGYIMYARFKIIDHIRSYSKTYATVGALIFACGIILKTTYPWGALLYVVPIIGSVLIYIILATKERVVSEVVQKTSVIEYMGRISYGLYAYHMFAVVIVQKFLFPTYSNMPLLASLMTLAITIVIAHISYKYMESWFLKFK